MIEKAVTLGIMTGVAVSGGADSIYLLHEILGRGVPVTVLHVNHKLRGEESDADERFVRALGHPTLVLNGPPGPGGNLEQAAREIRYGWFRRLVQQGVVDQVALGHTRSDQAETVLFRFLRGAGTAGLAGIRPETSGGFVRPLLHLTREQVRGSLRAREIPWREDSSNGQLRFSRNRIRRELLPQLQRDWNPRIEAALAQTADWAGAEEAYWAEEVRRLAGKYIRSEPPDLIMKWPGSLPLAAQRRLVRHAIELAKGDLRRIEFGHVEAILNLRAKRLCLPALVVERSFEELRFGPHLGIPEAFSYPIQPPNSASGVHFALKHAGAVYNDDEQLLDWDRVSSRLRLRNWHPGDRYRRVGRTDGENLKLLFQKDRIPVWERRSWPVLVCEDGPTDRIVWCRHFGISADAALSGKTRVVLAVRDLSNRNTENIRLTIV